MSSTSSRNNTTKYIGGKYHGQVLISRNDYVSCPITNADGSFSKVIYKRKMFEFRGQKKAFYVLEGLPEADALSHVQQLWG